MDDMENKTKMSEVSTKEEGRLLLSEKDAAEYYAYKKQKKIAHIMGALARSEGVVDGKSGADSSSGGTRDPYLFRFGKGIFIARKRQGGLLNRRQWGNFDKGKGLRGSVDAENGRKGVDGSNYPFVVGWEAICGNQEGIAPSYACDEKYLRKGMGGG